MSQSAAADPVLFRTQHRRKAAPDIDPLPWISVTGFRNPGKDQQLELNLGRAWVPEGLEPLLIPFRICLQPSSTTATLSLPASKRHCDS